MERACIVGNTKGQNHLCTAVLVLRFQCVLWGKGEREEGRKGGREEGSNRDRKRKRIRDREIETEWGREG